MNNNYNDPFNGQYGNTNNNNNDNNNVYSNSPYNNADYQNPYSNTNIQQNITGTEYDNNLYSLSNASQSSYNNSYTIPKHTKKKGGSKSALKIIAAALCFGIIAGGTMFGINYAGNELTNTSSTASSQSSNGKTASTIKNTSDGEVGTTYDVATVVQNVMPAMVSINIKATTQVENPYSQFFNFGYGNNDTYEYQTEGSGSGIIISENSSELLIVTNNHVVEDATEINVTFVNEQSCSATVKGTDPDHDLAVISVKLSDIPQDTKAAISIATLGDSTKLQLGQPAIAIGNALGYGQSVTVGYISALEREVQMTDNTMSLIQTDAAINPGNSGGALLDMNGNVIGINSAKYTDTDVEGMGYAIPISVASPIIDDLINNTTVSESQQAYLGIIGTDVTTSYSQSFGLPAGVYISKVNSSSPAAKAGIQAGDIITKFDGKEISTMNGLQAKLKNKKAGDTVEITLQRQQANGDFKEETISVTLGAKSDAPESDNNSSSNSDNSGRQNNKNSQNSFSY